MSRPIPEIRDDMLKLAAELREAAERLEQMAEDTRRRPAVTSAAPTSVPMTPVLAKRIRWYAGQYPRRSQQQIAVRFGVNIGRVSEALHGDK